MLISFWVCPNAFMSGSLNSTIHTRSKEHNTLVESAHSKRSPHWASFKSISLSQMSRHDWCIFKKRAVWDNQSVGLVGLLGLPLSVRFLWSLVFTFISSSPVTIHIWSFIKDLRFTRNCFYEAVRPVIALWTLLYKLVRIPIRLAIAASRVVPSSISSPMICVQMKNPNHPNKVLARTGRFNWQAIDAPIDCHPGGQE